MHRIQGWTGLRAAVIALGLVAWTATGATAAPLTYSTSGQVDRTIGVSGTTNVISFDPLNTANAVDLSTGQTNASLGNFVVTQLAPGVSTTYTNTPFTINFLPQSYGSDTTVAKDASGNSVSVALSGVLNGVVNGASTSTVTATFNSLSPDSISLGSGNGFAKFSLPSSILLAPSTSNSGRTTAQGVVTLGGSSGGSSGTGEPVPEPSTIALFLTTVGGLGLRRYVLSRRRPAKV